MDLTLYKPLTGSTLFIVLFFIHFYYQFFHFLHFIINALPKTFFSVYVASHHNFKIHLCITIASSRQSNITEEFILSLIHI